MIASADGAWPHWSSSRTAATRGRRPAWADEAAARDAGTEADGAMALLAHVLDLSRQSAAYYAFGADGDGAVLLEARWPLLSRLGELLGGHVAEADARTTEWGSRAGVFDASMLASLASLAAELGRLDAEIEWWSRGRGDPGV